MAAYWPPGSKPGTVLDRHISVQDVLGLGVGQLSLGVVGVVGRHWVLLVSLYVVGHRCMLLESKLGTVLDTYIYVQDVLGLGVGQPTTPHPQYLTIQH